MIFGAVPFGTNAALPERETTTASVGWAGVEAETVLNGDAVIIDDWLGRRLRTGLEQHHAEQQYLNHGTAFQIDAEVN